MRARHARRLDRARATLAPEAQIVADYVERPRRQARRALSGASAARRRAPWAVFVNGSLGHMLDYDDVGAGGHVSIVTMPVAFAVAEKLGGVSGRDLITAVAAAPTSTRG